MDKRIIVVLERPVADGEGDRLDGVALGRAVEAHPSLEPLLDFAAPDPLQIAAQVGVSYAYDPDDAEDLAEINFGPPEWHEPAAGLAATRKALDALRAEPRSIAAATYDPGLRPEDVIADLEALEDILRLAQRHETRFRLVLAA